MDVFQPARTMFPTAQCPPLWANGPDVQVQKLFKSYTYSQKYGVLFFNHHCDIVFVPVSYTPLTLPTNREV